MASFPSTGAHSSPADGQNHDRLIAEMHNHHDHHHHHPHNNLHDSHNPLASAMADSGEITAVQKMLSATSGSLLTALLATPLDVVRVRLQAQRISKPTATRAPIDWTRLAIPYPANFRPADLGVTACCREVFFSANTAEVCILGPHVSVAGAPSSFTPTTSSSTAAAISCAVEETQQRTFNSTIDGLRKIARHEGITTLWRGLSPTLIMAIPANIIYFTGYDWLRYNPSSPFRRIPLVTDEYVPLVAGSVARVLAATAVSPIELFRTRLQAAHGQSHPLRETFRGVKQMVEAHGYRALWRGLTLTLWRDVPFSGIYWYGYETIRGRLREWREERKAAAVGFPYHHHQHHLRHAEFAGTNDMERGRTMDRISATLRTRSQSRENHRETFTDSFIAGAMSGGFASVVTMPFDVGKTRTQVFRDAKSSSAGAAAAANAKAAVAPEETNMVRLLWHIFRAEGISGLFRGWIPRTLRVAPSCAVMISSYEVGKRVFKGVNERHARERGQMQREMEREP